MNKPCCCPHCGYCSKPPRIEYVPSYYPLRQIQPSPIFPYYNPVIYGANTAQAGVTTTTLRFNQQAQGAAVAEACCEAPKT